MPGTNAYALRLGDEIHSVEDVNKKKDVFKKRMNILKRCKWALKRKNDFEGLLEKLRFYNAQLYRFCPEQAWDDMNRFRFLSYLDCHNQPKALEISSRKTNQLVQDQEDPSMQKGLALLRDMMKLKGKAGFHNSKAITESERQDLLRYSPYSLQFHSSTGPSTIARLTGSNNDHSMVYIEFKSYRNDDGDKDLDRQDAILKLGRLMLDSDTPDLLNTMACMGLFKDSLEGRIGFIFRLPMHLRRVSSESLHQDDWDLRRPRRLLSELYSNPRRPPSLGWRFNLAKKLLDNVIRLHACGWLHKNIRADSVIFFPANTKPLTRGKIDYSMPYLMGYDYLRLDTVPKDNVVLHRDRLLRTTDQRNIRVGDDKRPDIYHHPDKRKYPMHAYQYAYDIYSLGLLLVEVGLWKPLPVLVASMKHVDPYVLQKYIENDVLKQVISHCGHIYANVVRKFITMTSRINEESRKFQRDLCAKMASELSKCVA